MEAAIVAWLLAKVSETLLHTYITERCTRVYPVHIHKHYHQPDTRINDTVPATAFMAYLIRVNREIF